MSESPHRDIHSQNGAGRNHEWHHIAHAEEVDDCPDLTGGPGSTVIGRLK